MAMVTGCQEKKDSKQIYRGASLPPLDSTCAWLTKRSHFNDPDFYPVYTAYYQRKLRKKDYAAAAEALHTVMRQEAYYQQFRKETLMTGRAFKAHFGRKLTWDKRLFLDSYIGNYYTAEGAYRKAIPNFIRITQHVPFDYASCVEIAYAHSDIAFCCTSIGEHNRALKHNLRALALFNKTDLLTGKSAVYDNIAIIHLNTKNYAEADAYFDKAMAIYRQTGDTSNMCTTLYDKILLYDETGNPLQAVLVDSAYRLFRESKLQDLSLEVAVSTMHVDQLLREGKTAESKVLLDELKPKVEQLNTPRVDADYHISVANYEIATGGSIRHPEVVEEALAAAEENEDFQNQMAFCDVLKENAGLKGDYKKALLYSEKGKTALNHLTNLEMVVKTMELNKQHQTEKKEQEISLQKATISNNKTAIAFLVSLLAALFLVIAVVLTFQKQRKIRAENRNAQLYTKQLLEKTEEERKRIASDLHDSVSHELLNLKHTIGKDTSATSDKIDTILNDIRSISRNLHPVMFEKVGLAASIEQLIERAQSVNDLMVTADIDYKGSLSATDELQVYRIIQEALSNIIKYAEAVAAKIIVLENDHELHIEIKDNGKGFLVQEALSGPDAFGLHNIIERSKAIGGLARISSDKSGTIITIDLKKRK